MFRKKDQVNGRKRSSLIHSAFLNLQVFLSILFDLLFQTFRNAFWGEAIKAIKDRCIDHKRTTYLSG
jgi:hypothetical protein